LPSASICRAWSAETAEASSDADTMAVRVNSMEAIDKIQAEFMLDSSNFEVSSSQIKAFHNQNFGWDMYNR
jgi:hypothetical protein